jgi:hypothetical protein
MHPARLIDLLHTLALIVLAILICLIMAGVPFAWRGTFC